MNLENSFISIVSPVYQAENIVDEFVKIVIKNISLITKNYEIVLVEDRSNDQSWEKIEKLCSQNNRIKGIKLSRNFGQHYAITAGLDYAKGDWVIVMDCDLQDRPEEFVALFNKAQEGFDAVLAKRKQRQDPFLKRFFSKSFYAVLSFLSGVKFDHSIANFGIYHQKVIQSVLQMREKIRFFPTMIKWVGFKITSIEVKHSSREEGKSSYNLRKQIKLAIDILLANSDRPLKLIVLSGMGVSILSFVYAIVVLVKALQGKIAILGYTSLFTSFCFFSGLIIFTIGIVGLYIGKIFEGIKNRPIYLIDEKKNI